MTHASRPDVGWATTTLSDSERDILADAARMVNEEMLADHVVLAKFASSAWDALDAHTRDLVAALAAGASARPELYIRNLPLDPMLPPTPTTSTPERSTLSFVSELVMAVFTTTLGTPMSYADQRYGSIFHDIFPTLANAAKVSSQSSLVSLGFHSEMFFHPTPPVFLMLHCLRPDPTGSALTGVADLLQIEESLTLEDQEVLRCADFALDLARLHGSYRYGKKEITEDAPRPCIPVISDGELWRFRFEPALMTPMTTKSYRALEHAEHAAESTAVYGTLQSGSVLLVDNRRSAHSRSPFDAKFDGTDRWLRRMMVAPFKMPIEGGVVRCTDLDLWKPWHQLGASFGVVPYT